VFGTLFSRPYARPVADAFAAPPPLGLRMPLAAGFGKSSNGKGVTRQPYGSYSGISFPRRDSRKALKAATGGVSGWPSSQATPISRTARGR